MVSKGSQRGSEQALGVHPALRSGFGAEVF